MKCSVCHMEVEPFPMQGWDTAITHPEGTNIERFEMCTADKGVEYDVCTNCQNVMGLHKAPTMGNFRF